MIVKLETIEKTMRLADGVDYTIWTFGGTMPGNFIRVREGDLVELHAQEQRAAAPIPHNIDLHAVTGPGGGAEATLTMPGGESKFTFRALNPGLYVYHCADVARADAHRQRDVRPDPRRAEGGHAEGRPRVLRDAGRLLHAKAPACGPAAPLDMEKALAEQPTHVVFNGAVGALTGDKALQAKVGETVRLFVGNGGPNLVSSLPRDRRGLRQRVRRRRNDGRAAQRADDPRAGGRCGDRRVPRRGRQGAW